jgi:CRP-like cAMP-binding protein
MLMPLGLTQVFLSRGRMIEVEPGQIIVSRSSRTSDIYLVTSGEVLLQSSSVQGRQFVIDLVRPGELFGFTGVLGWPVDRLDAIAHQRSQIVGMEPAAFERALLEEPAFAHAVVLYFLKRLQRRTRQVEDFAMLSFGSRLARWLLELALTQSAKVEANATFTCDFSQSLIAMMIGVSRETVSRQLQRWEERGILSHSGKTFRVLDPDLLRRIADGFSEAD